MALSFNDSVGVSYDADPSYFDGPDPTTVDLVGEAIDSAEAFGTFVIDQRVFGNGLASSEAFGTLLVTSRIQNLTGIPTAESVPTGAHAKHRILGQGFEDPSVVNNVQLNRRLYAVGIASSEAFGTFNTQHRLAPFEILAPIGNILKWSQDFNHAPWFQYGITVVTNDAIAPDGTMTADKVTGNGTNDFAQSHQDVTVWNPGLKRITTFRSFKNIDADYLLLFMRNNAHNERAGAWFIWTGNVLSFDKPQSVIGATLVSQTVVDQGNGWYRASITVDFDTPFGAGDSIEIDAHQSWVEQITTSFHMWGAVAIEGDYTGEYVYTEDRNDAFGPANRINHQLLIPAIASTEAFGTSRIDLQLEPVGIPSGEAHGVGRYSYPYDETPAPWSFDNDPGTFDGTEFWQAINFLGIASAEAFGTLEVKFGFSPVAIPSEEAFGTPRATLQVNAPASIPSLEAFGSPQINHQLLGQGFVDPSIFSVNGQVIHRLDIVGIPSEEAFGTQYLGYSYDGAPTPWSFDNEIITFDGPELWQVINFLGFISAEAFGTANITFPVYPASINSLEAFGSVQLDQRLSFTGIESTEAFGGLQVDLPLFVSAIPGQEALGTPNVLQAVNGFAGISSAEAFGTPFLSQRLFIVGIASTEAFGTFEIRPVWESVDPVSSSWSGVSAQVTVWSEVSAIGLSWSALSPIASIWSPASSQTSAWGVASSQSTLWSALESAQASWVSDSSMSLTWTPVASVPKSWTSATPASTTWSKAA